MTGMIVKELRVKREAIALLQFLIEGYEGLGTLTTLDARSGRIRFLIPEGLQADAEEILEGIRRELPLKEESVPPA